MDTLLTIRTLHELQALQDLIDDSDYVALDCETTGLDKDAKIIGFSVCMSPSIAFYVILSYWDTVSKSMITLETMVGAQAFFTSLMGKKLIGHNFAFDARMIENNFSVSLMQYLHTDTMVLAHLLDENRSIKLKALGAAKYGEDVKKEQIDMQLSVLANGGVLTKKKYELYKADMELIAKYGAQDAMLTLKLFYDLTLELFEQGLDKFFYDDETMPLLKGPTYEMNTTGLRIDPDTINALRGSLESENAELKSLIEQEIKPYVQESYPGTNKKNNFNISSNRQLSWLLFEKLGNLPGRLTPTGLKLCKANGIKPPYTDYQKREFKMWCRTQYVPIDTWKYLSVDVDSIEPYASKYKWLERLMQYAKNRKLLKTYITPIQDRLRYNIIHPDFLQHGTTSGRYSCRNPNFQNLPRDDKRIKACVVARPGRVFVGADYSQLEPRVFASVSQDPTLLATFEKGLDFYSVIGASIFEKVGCSLIKNDKDSFAKQYPELRQIAKAFALATPYGTSAFRQSKDLDLPVTRCQEIIDKYFEVYPQVELMMLESHLTVKSDGVVHSLYGRPRRIPAAKNIEEIYGSGTLHADLPYEARNMLNLAMNHRVQSSAASIVNRAMIAFYKEIRLRGIQHAYITSQIHDEIIVECDIADGPIVSMILQVAMENTTLLPGVKLLAKPVIAYNMADLKE